jgi:hypothetical protein
MGEVPVIGPGLTFVHSACGGQVSVRHETVGRRGPLGLFKEQALVVECAECRARCEVRRERVGADWLTVVKGDERLLQEAGDAAEEQGRAARFRIEAARFEDRIR